MVNAYSVFLKFAKLWELQRNAPRLQLATSSAPESGVESLMFSLHIDTARTWRGGQSQVMHTVLGPARASAARGARGASRRRAVSAHVGGHRPDPAGAATRDRSGRRVAAVTRHQAAAGRTSFTRTIRMPWPWRRRRCRSRRHHRSRRSSRRGASSSASRTTRFRDGSTARWTASSPSARPIRDRLVADGIPRQKTTIVNEGVDVERIVHLPAANVHAAFYLPTHAPVVGNVAALVRTRASST